MPTPCFISVVGKNRGNITAGAFTADSVGNIFVEGHEVDWEHSVAGSSGADDWRAPAAG